MRDQRIPGPEPDDPDTLKQALLGLLVCDYPSLWTLTELDRQLQPSSATPPGAEPSRIATEDALEDLYAAGLVHRLGVYVFATRAAHEAHRLAG
jgi:aryl-alcohol dehydrogenase-like predicted oxidoreductase